MLRRALLKIVPASLAGLSVGKLLASRLLGGRTVAAGGDSEEFTIAFSSKDRWQHRIFKGVDGRDVFEGTDESGNTVWGVHLINRNIDRLDPRTAEFGMKSHLYTTHFMRFRDKRSAESFAAGFVSNWDHSIRN